MTDQQPKPMSVEEAKKKVFMLDKSDYGGWRVDKDAVENLIKIVRADTIAEILEMEKESKLERQTRIIQ